MSKFLALLLLTLSQASFAQDFQEASPEELRAEIEELERLGAPDDSESEDLLSRFAQTTAGSLKIEVYKRPKGFGIGTEFLVASVNGEVEHVFLASSGLQNGWTPAGRFRIFRMHKVYTSRKYNSPMDWAMFFNGGIAVHSTISDNYPILGTPASKGCVRLSRPAARKLFELTQRMGVANTQVIVYASGAQPSAALLPFLEDELKRDRANINDLLKWKRSGKNIDRGGQGDFYPKDL